MAPCNLWTDQTKQAGFIQLRQFVHLDLFLFFHMYMWIQYSDEYAVKRAVTRVLTGVME